MSSKVTDIPWVVCDFETTGIHPSYHHRVVEIGLVWGAGREIQGEWTSTVNPQRDVTASAVHGLRGADVMDSPTFEQIAGSLLDILSDRVLVAHNAPFDSGFFESELDRLGIAHGKVEWFCTLRAMSNLGIHPANLEACCAAYGISVSDTHTALADATACAELVAMEYDQFAPKMSGLKAFSFDGQLEASVAARPRGASLETPKRSLRDIAIELPERADVDQSAVESYAQLLARVLEDRRVTEDEHAALLTCAHDLGVSREVVESIHSAYLATLNARFLRDGFQSEAEQRELRAVEALIGTSAESTGTSVSGMLFENQDSLAGATVCFTGELESTINGSAISRSHAQRLAEDAGLINKSGVSKKLDLLVVVDPESLSGKARKARDLGVRLISERAFWDAIGVEVD